MENTPGQYTCGEQNELEIDLHMRRKELCLEFYFYREDNTPEDFEFSNLEWELKHAVPEYRTLEESDGKSFYRASYGPGFRVTAKVDSADDVRVRLFKKTNAKVTIHDVVELYHFYFLFRGAMQKGTGNESIDEFEYFFREEFGYNMWEDKYDKDLNILKKTYILDNRIKKLKDFCEEARLEPNADIFECLKADIKGLVTEKHLLAQELKYPWITDPLKAKREKIAKEYRG
jgi:hypothetical protein